MDSLPLPFTQLIIQLLGLPGLIFIIWHFDNKRLDKQQAVYREQQQQYRNLYEKEQQKLRESYDREHRADRDATNKILSQYKDDVNNIASLYKNNVHLVGDYDRAMLRMEKLSEEMMSVVSLNAQASSHLAEAIKNNTFCPQVRQQVGKS
ncbi:MAG TPA: hypothetical protein HPP94_08690 [Desulfuromonadales bacterium]|nr:hypothetical protein [Desulfuromonadales bacterium]